MDFNFSSGGGKCMKILIIDHESLLSTEIKKELKHRGFKTYQTALGTFNDEEADLSNYDLILLDVPVMSDESYLAIKKIRASDKHVPHHCTQPFPSDKKYRKMLHPRMQ